LEYLTIRQVAERLQVSTKTISRRIDDGSLPAIRLGDKTIRIDEAELQKYIDTRRTTSAKHLRMEKHNEKRYSPDG
jgi:excisionase family DNA binding protein